MGVSLYKCFACDAMIRGNHSPKKNRKAPELRFRKPEEVFCRHHMWIARAKLVIVEIIENGKVTKVRDLP